MLETVITGKILEYLDMVPMCTAEKIPGNSMGKKGRSDIVGCFKGTAFRIEVKSPDHDNKPTLAQSMNLKKWAKAGAVAFSAYSLADVQCIINVLGRVDLKHFKGQVFSANIGGGKKN